MQSWEPWKIRSREETLRNHGWEVDLGVFSDRLGLPASFFSLLDCVWGKERGKNRAFRVGNSPSVPAWRRGWGWLRTGLGDRHHLCHPD